MLFIFKYLFMFYIGIYITATLHEFGHCIGALIIRAPIVEIVLGDRQTAINFKNIYLSYKLENFYVVANLIGKGKYETLIYYCAGSVINFLMILTLLFVNINIVLNMFFIIFNILSIFKSLSPFYMDSDYCSWKEIYRKDI